MRSRAVSLPRSRCLSTACSGAGWAAASRRCPSPSIFPAVVFPLVVRPAWAGILARKEMGISRGGHSGDSPEASSLAVMPGTFSHPALYMEVRATSRRRAVTSDDAKLAERAKWRHCGV